MLAYLARDFEAAIAAIDLSLTLNPNSASAYGNSGLVRAWMGEWQTAIDHFHKEARLGPLDPGRGYSATGLCLALLAIGRHEEALAWAYKARLAMPTLLPGLRALVATLVELGRLDEARAAAQRLLVLDPRQTIVIAQQSPHQDPQFRTRFFAALRAAGVPE